MFTIKSIIILVVLIACSYLVYKHFSKDKSHFGKHVKKHVNQYSISPLGLCHTTIFVNYKNCKHCRNHKADFENAVANGNGYIKIVDLSDPATSLPKNLQIPYVPYIIRSDGKVYDPSKYKFNKYKHILDFAVCKH
jgi:hypothetical protein